MKTIEKECKQCGKSFEASLKEHKRGNAKFCSRACSYAFRSSQPKKPKEPNCECAHCGTKFWKKPSRKSKSGLYFCKRECKDEAQRIGGLEEIMPSHYGTGDFYRSICWRHHEKKCIICGESKIVAVHHYDHNHGNNEPSNLIPLCPTHHCYVHSKHRDEVQGKIDEWRNNYLTSIS